MRSVRRLFAAAALLAALGLAAAVGPAGRSRADDKAKGGAAPNPEEVAQAVKDIATAYDLIDYGRRTKDPKALCLGVQMLTKIQEPTGEIKVEGAGKDKVPDKEDQLKKILAEVKKMPTAGNPTNMALITETMDEVAGGSRGTVNGGTSWQGIVNPNTAVTLTRKFLGKQVATVCVAKVFNVGVALDVQVHDQNGHEVKHDVGNSLRFDWKPEKDEDFKIVVQNKHTAGVLVKVTTN